MNHANVNRGGPHDRESGGVVRSDSCWLVWSALFGAVAASSRALAFCGFFVAGSDAKLTNDASQVVLMRKGNRTVMTMSNDYKGPPEDFAMVVPVPVVLHKEDVKTLPADVFDHIDSLSAPRLVEYWEQDPAGRAANRSPMSAASAAGRMRRWRHDAPSGEDLGVKIEAQFVAGEYQILILSATESQGLETWLHREKYHIPAGAAAALAPYVRDKSKFFVAKVDVKKVKRDAAGVVHLSPLRFAFDANELRLPVRLGLLNASGKQDLIVYVLHPSSRFEVANYPNVFVPTNLEVADGVRKGFPGFYADALRRHHREDGAQGGGDRVRVADHVVRPLSDAAAHRVGPGDAGARRARRCRHRGSTRRPRAVRASRARRRRAGAADAVLRRGRGLGAHAAAHALQRRDPVRGFDLPRGEAGHGRPRQLERHQR